MRSIIILFLAVGLLLCALPAEAVLFHGDKQDSDSLRAQQRKIARELRAQRPEGAVSGLGAFSRSLIIPTWGQHAVASTRPELKGRGRWQLWVEIALVGATWGLYEHGRMKEHEYMTQAEEHAGIRRHSRSSDYWVDISKYDSVEEYNTAMLQVGSPGRRYLDPTDAWSWTSSSHRIRYRDTRAYSEDAYSAALATAGMIVVNHLFSAVHALRLVNEADQLPQAEVAMVNERPGLVIHCKLLP